jgi:hypothetical protein
MDGPTVTAAAAAVGAAVALGNAYRQDMRAQFTQMINILSQQDARFDSPDFRVVRAKAAQWIRAGSDPDDIGGDDAARAVLNFFETLAFLHRREAVDSDAVWHYFASWLLPYHVALRPLVARSQADDPNTYREYSALYDAIFQVEREKRNYRGTEQVISAANVAAVLEAECKLV